MSTACRKFLNGILSEELAVNFSTRKLDSLRLKHTKLELECEFLRLELIRTNEVENTWATIRNEFQQKISQIPEQIPASILKITNLVDAKQQLREIFAQTLEDLSKLKPQTKEEWGIKVLWNFLFSGFSDHEPNFYTGKNLLAFSSTTNWFRTTSLKAEPSVYPKQYG